MLETLNLDYVQHLERGYCANHPDVLSGAQDQVVDRAVKQLLQALQAYTIKDLTNGIKIGNGLLKYDADAWQYSNDNGATWQAIGSGAGDHLLLSNIGSNSHAQIDTHIADSAQHYTQAQIDHLNLLNSGNWGHGAIDAHLNNSSIHTPITNHTDLSNIGTNTHAQIDDHIANTTIHGGGGGGATPTAYYFQNANPTITTAMYTGSVLYCEFSGTLNLPAPTTDGQSIHIVRNYGTGTLTITHHIQIRGEVGSVDENNEGGYLYCQSLTGSLMLVYKADLGAWISLHKTGTWEGSTGAY